MEEQTRKLPIVDIFLRALLVPVIYWRRILWFAIPVIAIELIVVYMQFDLDPESEISGVTLLQSFSLGVASYIASLLLAVACHRIFILGTDAMTGSFLRWTFRETKFLGWGIGLGLIALCLGLPIGLVLTAVVTPETFATALQYVFIVFLPVAYVISRLSLVLPAAAIDATPSLGWAWETSKGNGWRLLAVVGLLPFLLNVVISYLPVFDSLIYFAVLSWFWIYVGVVGIAALSLSYRELTKDPPDERIEVVP